MKRLLDTPEFQSVICLFVCLLAPSESLRLNLHSFFLLETNSETIVALKGIEQSFMFIVIFVEAHAFMTFTTTSPLLVRKWTLE